MPDGKAQREDHDQAVHHRRNKVNLLHVLRLAPQTDEQLQSRPHVTQNKTGVKTADADLFMGKEDGYNELMKHQRLKGEGVVACRGA